MAIPSIEYKEIVIDFLILIMLASYLDPKQWLQRIFFKIW